MKEILYQLEHTILALAVCTLAVVLPDSKATIFTGICCFFVSREIAQAEYKYIHFFCGGRRSEMPPLAWCDPAVWDTHSFWWNMLAPILAAALVLWGLPWALS